MQRRIADTKTYRTKNQGYGKRKEAKRYLKRAWRRANKMSLSS